MKRVFAAAVASPLLTTLSIYICVVYGQWSTENAGGWADAAAIGGGTAAFVLVGLTIASWSAAHGWIQQLRNAPPAFRRVYTEPDGDEVKVLVHGGDIKQARTVGRFGPDDEDALLTVLTDERKAAEDYRSRVQAAARLSTTVNRGAL